MNRRRFRPLTSSSQPTMEDMTRRHPSRRFFRQLQAASLVPPIPTDGCILRHMTASAISDYAGISTASWSTGTTGTSTNWNCLYHHFVISNPLADSYDVIMQPVRYSPNAPTTNGGTFDFVTAPTSGVSRPGNVLVDEDGSSVASGQLTAGAGKQYSRFGAFACDQYVLPGTTHGTFKNGTAYIQPRVFVDSVRANSTTSWLESALYAISPSTKGLPNGYSRYIHAIQHRVNGSAVGDLVVDPGAPTVDTRMRVALSAGDRYEIDVWHRIKFSPSNFQPSEPRKWAYYIPTTKVSNGSMRRTASGIANAPPDAVIFGNVDWTPAFSWKDQTYNVTISGHTGWTLKDGSNGPHAMRDSTGWKGGAITLTSTQKDCVRFVPTTAGTYCRGIFLVYGVECPFAVLVGGSALNNVLYLYQPASAGTYRTSIYQTDLARTFTVCSSGPFDQDGTTTFELVPWSVSTTAYPASNSQDTIALGNPLGFAAAYLECHNGGIAAPLDEVPTSITFSRTTL